MTLTKEDIQLVKKFYKKYMDSHMWDCPICRNVDECRDWCPMPLFARIAEEKEDEV